MMTRPDKVPPEGIDAWWRMDRGVVPVRCRDGTMPGVVVVSFPDGGSTADFWDYYRLFASRDDAVAACIAAMREELEDAEREVAELRDAIARLGGGA